MKAAYQASSTADQSAQSSTEIEQTTDIQQALINAHGMTVTHQGRRYKLDCRMVNERFFCDAQNMTPRDADEAKFCFTDLWKSESVPSMNLTLKFARKGGFITKDEEATQRRHAGEQTEDDAEIYPTLA